MDATQAAAAKPAPQVGSAKARRRRKPAFHSKYVLLQKLGKGTFGSVYLTMQPSPGGGAAILATKVMDLRALQGGQSSVEKEAALLKRVHGIHHCVNIFCFHVVDGLGYIVMEKLDCSLLCALKGMPMLRESSFVRVFKEMMASLQGIHAVGVLHRDVKPSNFMCSGPALTVKLCDFGFAEVEPKATPGNPTPYLKDIVGTAPFMSPEMLQGTGHTRKTDIWSLGVLMYVIMLGHFPYAPTIPGICELQSHPPPSFELEASINLGGGRSISNCCEDLMRKLLCRDLHARPDAQKALQHEWYSETAERSTALLRLALFSAKKAGAFSRDKSLGNDHVDRLLQRRKSRHGVAPTPGHDFRKDYLTQDPYQVEPQTSPMKVQQGKASLISITTTEPLSPRTPGV